MKRIVVAIDAMGGDFGCRVTIPAALKTLEIHRNLEIVAVGDQEIIERVLQEDERYREQDEICQRLTVQHASQQVLMDELPSRALRSKRDSSMRVTIDLVANHKVDACVSSGNTGALVAISHFVLKMVPGVSRPAIVAYFPALEGGGTSVLDLGATVEARAGDLVELAIMGSVLSAVVNRVENPKVALLNIGSEEIKGNLQIKEAASLLGENPHINYVGFIEGDELFNGKVDVVVCDGFTGNVVLKTIEGTMKLVVKFLRDRARKSWLMKLLACLAWPFFRQLRIDLDPGQYNGASLLGLNGIVVKSHGSANVESFVHSIEKAMLEAQNNVPERIRAKLEQIVLVDNK